MSSSMIFVKKGFVIIAEGVGEYILTALSINAPMPLLTAVSMFGLSLGAQETVKR